MPGTCERHEKRPEDEADAPQPFKPSDKRSDVQETESILIHVKKVALLVDKPHGGEKEQLFDQMKTVQGRAMKLECAQLKARNNPKRFKQELNEELVSVPTDASPQDLASHSEQNDHQCGEHSGNRDHHRLGATARLLGSGGQDLLTTYHGALQQWFQVAYLSELYERLSRKGHSGRKTKAIVANVMNIALHSRAGDSSRKFSLEDQGTGVDSCTSDECQY
ncbi:uncharacterized protein EI90DRAFT_3019356 [Cantharellus anzutake]|uniref:uncharacterized protein n=1 Tax=Cantharellus anzutake TaxID=1750568 RepID=UPI001902C39A|nr:uncharacterized protein EI90DRAFT_3019356 [Cantharellus anzutake]KAF8324890.1 hypothetical protein EI90DRAFT_3019356 [Cantharellus anzutake]